MPVIDVSFKIFGNAISVDHGYQLFSAIANVIPSIHSNGSIGVHPIAGRYVSDRMMQITDRSYLTLRVPADTLYHIIPLAGKTLAIGNHSINLGVPNPNLLVAHANLYSRLVVIKGFMEPASFLHAVKNQLATMDIRGNPELIPQAGIAEANKNRNTGTHSAFLRRTIRIRDKEIVGFALRISSLSEKDSVLLQEQGVGGRQRFGCGIFIPDKR